MTISQSMLVALALSCSGLVLAQSPNNNEPPTPATRPIFHLTLDGELNNRGTIGGEAKLYTREGGQAPQAVPGKYGNALRFFGDSVLALPFDLSQEDYPDITLTAWVRVEEHETNGLTIVTSGSGTSMLVHNMGLTAKSITVGGPYYGPERGINPGEWTFLAASIKLSEAQMRMHLRENTYLSQAPSVRAPRSSRLFKDPSDPSIESQPYIFVGAEGFSLGWPAKNITIIPEKRTAGWQAMNRIITSMLMIRLLISNGDR